MHRASTLLFATFRDIDAPVVVVLMLPSVDLLAISIANQTNSE